MRKINKTASAVFFCIAILVAVSTALVSCSGEIKPIESSEQDLTVVGTVAGYDVPYEELRFVVLTNRNLIEQKYGDDALETSSTDFETYRAMLEESVYENIKSNYAVLDMCAEVGISPDDRTLQDAVAEKINELADELGGARKYREYLAQNNMTDRFFRFNTLVDLMQNELYHVYTDDLGIISNDDDELYELIKKEFIRTEHIYISKSNGRSDAENRAAIEEAYARVCADEDFLALADEYGEDPDMGQDGLYIIKGYMSETYENAAFSLDIGEYSGIIEDDSGYYIIRRTKPDTLYLLTNFDMLADRYKHYTFIAMIDKTAASLSFTLNDYGASLELLDIK
ncbi:MAG: peptidylprolyl isomerase [Eubacteriales bacterium]